MIIVVKIWVEVYEFEVYFGYKMEKVGYILNVGLKQSEFLIMIYIFLVLWQNKIYGDVQKFRRMFGGKYLEFCFENV